MIDSYIQAGKIDKAITLQREVVEVKETAPDCTFAQWASAISDLASFYSSKGDYNQAIEIGETALKMLGKKLGEKHYLPIEVFPRALKYVSDELRKIGATEIIYKGLTDNNNSIINVKFENTDLDETLAKQIKLITGVIESGLFCNFNITVVK